MATQQWGRKETIIFPPHSPIYSYGAVFLAFVLTGCFLYARFDLGQTPLQQFYTPIYARAAAGGALKKKNKFQLLYVGNGVAPGQLAAEADVQSGTTAALAGKHIPLALSRAGAGRGLRALYRGPEQIYVDAPLTAYLKSTVFEDASLWEIYKLPLLFGCLSLLIQLPFSIVKDIARRKQMKYGRLLKGPVMLTPKEFNKTVQGDGIGFKTTEAKEMMRIPLQAEAQHIELMGDTGAGKTTLIMQILRQIQGRGHSAIVYDPACEFIQRFYDAKRGDIVLNPLDARCPYWGPSEELRRKAEAKAIAASLYQPTSDKKGEFFTETPQKIFAHLLTFGPTPGQLVAWLSNPAEIDQRVRGTEMEAMIAKGAQQQRNGVLASLGLVADSLRMLPTKAQAKTSWSATEWSEKREGWIFITSSATEREALRPLHSLWIDLLVLRLLTAPQDSQTPVWFVLDELASLQRLPQLHTAITENRKSRNPLVLGFQGKAQLEVIYGHVAEVMLSQPATKIFLKTTEPKAAEWVSNAIGKVVTVALTELERYTQARIGGNHPAETTGKFIVAKFEHDTARPVEGYAAPQLHTHAVIFNMTERGDGSARAIQPQSYFDSQQFATAVYQSELTFRLRNLGYEIEAGKSGAPDVKGYTAEYLEASSPRRQQIEEAIARSGFSGPEAAQIAAHNTRDRKEIHTPSEVLAAHRQIAAEFGNQADHVVTAARERAEGLAQNRVPDAPQRAQEAVSFAKDRSFEREAVTDERDIMRDALRRGMGDLTHDQVRTNFDQRHSSGEFQTVDGQKHETGRQFTTRDTIAAELATIGHMQRGQNAVEPILPKDQAAAHANTRELLNPAQRRAIEEVLTSHDRVHGLQGLAGSGKTTALETIREGAERNGYAVEGFAPTSRAAAQLREAGISADTLQSFLVRGGQEQANGDPDRRHLYMVDESSLASTRQMQSFMEKIGPQDRVLLIGDTRQHQGVDAGKPFEQMQHAGMQTSQLDQIMRQKDPELLRVVEHFSKNETAVGVGLLQQQGRVTEIPDNAQRIEAIAKDYAAKPENTLVVSPDNASRREINDAIRHELKGSGAISKDDHRIEVLTQRSELTSADRTWAVKYQPDDVLYYTRGSKEQGIEPRSYATVVSIDAVANQITVAKNDGQQVTYDPERLRGITAYREIRRDFAEGDRIQFTATNRDLGVSNRDLGAIQRIDGSQIDVKMDGEKERTVSFDSAKMRHFDHGYAVTSHSSQGLTTDRVLVNMDTTVHPELINTRFAYVSISRASQDARIYTNDAGNLGERLSTDVTKTSAIDLQKAPVEPTANQHTQEPPMTNSREHPQDDLRREPPSETMVSLPEIIRHEAEVDTRHYAPIEAAMPNETAGYEWKRETGEIESYKHDQTGGWLHIDPQANFYDREAQPISRENALEHANHLPSHTVGAGDNAHTQSPISSNTNDHESGLSL